MDHQSSWFEANAGWMGFAGLVVGVLGVVTGFLFYWWSRRPKRFGWQLISQTPILTADAKGLPLKILYDKKYEVSKPNLIILRFGNRGKVELRSEDYDRPVTVTFTKSKLIGAVLVDGLCLDVNAELTQSGSSVTFTPPMLNKGEWLDLQFVTDGPLEVPTVKARVAGQSGNTDELARSRRRMAKRLLLTSFLIYIAVFSIAVVLSVTRVVIYPFIPGLLAALFLIGMAMSMIAFLQLEHDPVWSKQPTALKTAKSGNTIKRVYQGARKWME